jgi:hypothetical protein
MHHHSDCSVTDYVKQLAPYFYAVFRALSNRGIYHCDWMASTNAAAFAVDHGRSRPKP